MELIEKFINKAAIDSKEFYDYVEKVDNDTLLEFLNTFNDIINLSTNSSKIPSGFDFIANSTLSGLPFPCEEIYCRLENVEKLARNSILYADTVYIQNPFDKYLKYKSFDKTVRLNIVNDLIILHFIRPLLKAGIFKFAVSKVHYCNDCYRKFQDEYLNDFTNNLRVIEALVEEYIFNNIEFNLILSHGKKCVSISGKNDLLEHPIIISFKKYVPKSLDSLTLKGKKTKLKPIEIKESGMLYYLMNDLVDNLSIQDYFSRYNSAHILTNREFDIAILKIINGNKPTESIVNHRIEILKNINHIVPFLDSVSIDKLLKIRKNEGEAFQVYRDKINKIVKSNSRDSKEYIDYYQDEIRPELNRITLTLKNNRKLLWGNVKSNIFLASTYVSATLFSGILPSNIDKIVASIGGFGFSKSIGQDIIKMIKKPEVRDNELYFLWKLQKENKIRI